MARRALLAVSGVLGIIASVLGAYHGYGEILQDNDTPKGIVINAFSRTACPPAGNANCFPAMTILPTTFLVFGTITAIVATLMLIFTILVIAGKNVGYILLVSSVVLLLVGGGFLPPILGTVSALISLRVNRKPAA
ncbi:MAG: hypothetical protein FJ358_04255 [Thaumarchaeota archaeon]|nr:hypothetical protein [Nitrososphaerota archaeon]